jgi:DNA-binding NarL/FixJ family response regulator
MVTQFTRRPRRVGPQEVTGSTPGGHATRKDRGERRPGERDAAEIRLLVLDDCGLKRLGIVAALTADHDMVVVGEVSDAETALRIVRDDDPDVAIVDAHAPGSQGMSAVRTLARAAPELPIAVVTASDHAEHLLEAVSAGVRGYLGRSASPAGLRAAVRTVHAGGTVIAPDLAGDLLRHLRPPERRSRPPSATALSRRERDILRLVMEGHTQEEIAAELEISERTVQLALARLREKTGLRRRSDLLRWAASQDVG